MKSSIIDKLKEEIMLNNVKKIFAFIIIAIFIIIFLFKNLLKNNNDYEKVNFNEIIKSNNIVENTSKEEKLDTIKVHIVGEVNNPGLIELSTGSRVADAIELANGLTNEADTSKTNLAYILSDGEKIYIPNINDEGNIEYTNMQESNSKININTATVAELKNIPGVGESTANSILEYRISNGKFSSIEDIKNVSGIGESKFNKMKDYIVVK